MDVLVPLAMQSTEFGRDQLLLMLDEQLNILPGKIDLEYGLYKCAGQVSDESAKAMIAYLEWNLIPAQSPPTSETLAARPSFLPILGINYHFACNEY
jgi:hypothetical protein